MMMPCCCCWVCMYVSEHVCKCLSTKMLTLPLFHSLSCCLHRQHCEWVWMLTYVEWQVRRWWWIDNDWMSYWMNDALRCFVWVAWCMLGQRVSAYGCRCCQQTRSTWMRLMMVVGHRDAVQLWGWQQLDRYCWWCYMLMMMHCLRQQQQWNKKK